MTSNYQNLSLVDLGIAASLIFVNGALSLVLKLGLERRLAWAAVRTIGQLLLIGYLLVVGGSGRVIFQRSDDSLKPALVSAFPVSTPTRTVPQLIGLVRASGTVPLTGLADHGAGSRVAEV